MGKNSVKKKFKSGIKISFELVHFLFCSMYIVEKIVYIVAESSLY